MAVATMLLFTNSSRGLSLLGMYDDLVDVVRLGILFVGAGPTIALLIGRHAPSPVPEPDLPGGSSAAVA